MSTVPRHVIVDLLPLYLAGEISADTQRIVDEYLDTDAELSAKVRSAASDLAAPTPAVGRFADREIDSVRRTRSMLALQRWLFGLAIGLTAVAFSLTASVANGRVAHLHLMLTDMPIPFGICLLAAAGFWLAYYRLRRRLRT